MNAGFFQQQLRDFGYRFFSGVPCSSLTPLFNSIISDKHSTYVAATHEGESIAICAGAWLAGRPAAMLCQNSGLGNIVNPITSLLQSYSIPVLIISSWRGMPGTQDEPQHKIMGQITLDLLKTMNVSYEVIDQDFCATENRICHLVDTMKADLSPGAIVIKPSTFDSENLVESQGIDRACGHASNMSANTPLKMSRADAIRIVTENTDESCLIISTTGKCSRELFTVNDHPRNFYVTGSMGCASAIGLGVSLNYSEKVIILDGDGALLMKFGNLATIGRYQPQNLVHIVLDNGVHESTGSQSTNGQGLLYSEIAAKMGYVRAWVVNSEEGLLSVIKLAAANPGPSFIHARIVPGSLDNLGRPTIALPDLALRFREYLSSANQDCRQ